MSKGFSGLLDDAALFPPASVPLTEAVLAHRSHRRAWYADLVGPFVCPAPRVVELATVLADEPLRVALTLPGGALGLPSALAACARLDAVRLTSVEVALPEDTTPETALAVLDDQLPPGVTGYLEVPLGHRAATVLDALAGTRCRAKFRTGGLEPSAHPSERDLADAILGAVRRGVAFKCTAGLHHATRHTDGLLEQHGFLNVLLATQAALHGASLGEVASLLAVRSADELAGPAETVADARAWFVSFGTCSIADPVSDLVRLDLLRQPEASRG